MELHYNQTYTKEQIYAVLMKIKKCVENNKFSIALNDKRQENIAFIHAYNLRSDKQKNILLRLKIEDFCHTLQNTKHGYEHEVLYVFVPRVSLFDANGNEEIVPVYVKFNVIDMKKGNHTLAISFHKQNKPIDYLFCEARS